MPNRDLGDEFGVVGCFRGGFDVRAADVAGAAALDGIISVVVLAKWTGQDSMWWGSRILLVNEKARYLHRQSKRRRPGRLSGPRGRYLRRYT